MTLVTLSGTISGSNLNNNFIDKEDAIKAVNEISSVGKSYEIIVDCVNLTDTTNEGLRRVTFTAPDDLEYIMGKLVVQDASNGITVTATLKAILPEDDTEIDDYLLEQSVIITGTTSLGAGVIAYDDRLTDPDTKKIFLIKGITYKLILTSNSATNLDRAMCNLMCMVRRRRS